MLRTATIHAITLLLDAARAVPDHPAWAMIERTDMLATRKASADDDWTATRNRPLTCTIGE